MSEFTVSLVLPPRGSSFQRPKRCHAEWRARPDWEAARERGPYSRVDDAVEHPAVPLEPPDGRQILAPCRRVPQQTAAIHAPFREWPPPPPRPSPPRATGTCPGRSMRPRLESRVGHRPSPSPPPPPSIEVGLWRAPRHSRCRRKKKRKRQQSLPRSLRAEVVGEWPQRWRVGWGSAGSHTRRGHPGVKEGRSTPPSLRGTTFPRGGPPQVPVPPHSGPVAHTPTRRARP